MGDTPQRVAGLAGVPKRPPQAEKMVQVAYRRCLGDSQKEAARAVRVGERTVRRYESHEWWPDAVQECRRRWAVASEVRARASVHQGVDDPHLGLRLLERLDRALSPRAPTTKVSVQGGASGSKMSVFVVGPGAAGGVSDDLDVADDDEEEVEDNGEE